MAWASSTRRSQDGVQRADLQGGRRRGHPRAVRGTSRFVDLADADLVVEAVFEDLAVKKSVFRAARRGLPPGRDPRNKHVFVPRYRAGRRDHTPRARRRPALLLSPRQEPPGRSRGRERHRSGGLSPGLAPQEALGKTPIALKRLVWLHRQSLLRPVADRSRAHAGGRLASTATIDEGAKKAFGIGMGPFELMNVTGVPIAFHTATTLGRAFGPMYASPALLRAQVDAGAPWIHRRHARCGTVRRPLAIVLLPPRALSRRTRGRRRRDDRGHRHRRASRPPLAARAVRADESPRSRSRPRPRRRLCRALEFTRPRSSIEKQARAGHPFHFTLVRSQVADGIATLTINRPDAMNALNEAVFAQLEAGFHSAAADSAVRGIVIAGSGKAFVAGADIRYFVRHIEAGTIDAIAEFTRRGQALLRAIETCAKPVVARVHGMALGGGVELALACHAIVATPKASLAFPETGIGIYPGLGGTQRTPRRIGTGLAKWLVLSGQTLGAEEAHGDRPHRQGRAVRANRRRYRSNDWRGTHGLEANRSWHAQDRGGVL